MIDQLRAILSATNPGLILIAAAALATLARGTPARAAVLIGGPIAALAAILYPAVSGFEAATGQFIGLEFAPYRPDSLSLVFGFAFVLAALMSGIYSMWREDPLQDAAGLAYAGSAMGVVFAGDMLSLLVFWELATLTSTALILARRTREAEAAATRYLVIQLSSGLLMMAGVAMYGVSVGSFVLGDLGPLRHGLLVGVFDISQPGAVMILLAAGIKAGFPLAHNWLTDAYPNSTETGAVTLQAYGVTMAVYVLARGFAGLEMLVWIGAVMTVYPVFFAVIENDLRRVLAYSSNNQVGFMVAAIGIGTPLAINGAAAHALAHIIFKGVLFMSLGAVMLRTGTTKATELGGLHRTMPFTTLACIIGAVSISALPFFSGFASKSMIMSAAHAGPGLYIAWVMMLFASAGVLEHAGIKIPYFAFFHHDSGRRPEEAPFPMLLAMGLGCAFCVGIGLDPSWFYELLPYRDEAVEYLQRDLFTPSHMLEQAQLLAFAALAFLVLKWLKLHPAERAGQILDVEWLWRGAAPFLTRKLAQPVGRVVAGAVASASGIAHPVWDGVRQVFAPGLWVSRHVPAGAGAVMAAGVLVLIMSLAIYALT